MVSPMSTEAGFGGFLSMNRITAADYCGKEAS